MTREEILEYCLNDAYALEDGAVELLRAQQGMRGNTADLDDKLSEWAEESKANAEDIRECIEAMGGRVSTREGMSPQLIKALEPIVTIGLPDQQVKNAALLHAFMHFGHASALALVRGGEALDEPSVSRLAEKLAKQKLANADWIEQRLPEIWDAFRDQELSGAAQTGSTAQTGTEERMSSRRPATAFHERLGDKTKAELEGIAKDMGLPYSNKNKDELVQEIDRNQTR
jgi:ferritin-like metal-binding protein YciE